MKYFSLFLFFPFFDSYLLPLKIFMHTYFVQSAVVLICIAFTTYNQGGDLKHDLIFNDSFSMNIPLLLLLKMFAPFHVSQSHQNRPNDNAARQTVWLAFHGPDAFRGGHDAKYAPLNPPQPNHASSFPLTPFPCLAIWCLFFLLQRRLK
jgi:hypothetical protein